MGRDEPTGEQPSRSSVGPTAGAPGSDGEDDVVPVAAQLLWAAEDALDGAGRRAADSLARRIADQRLLENLARQNFTGPTYEIFKADLAQYGLAVTRAWIRDGIIFKQCAEKGRPLTPTADDLENLARHPDERTELALETVATALDLFHKHVLLERKWTMEGGATLTTYFAGACVNAFPNIFRRWQGERRRWAEAHRQATLYAPDSRPLTNPDYLDPADVAAANDRVARELRRMPDTTAAAAILIINGATQAEAAERLGLTTRAAEGLLYRYRRRVAAAISARRPRVKPDKKGQKRRTQ